MKKSILDVEPMNRPILRESQREYYPDCGGLDDGTEGLIIINT